MRYLFVIFLSLIVYTEAQKEIKSVEKSIDILRNLKCKVFGRDIVIQELTKEHKKLFEKIGTIVPNAMRIGEILAPEDSMASKKYNQLRLYYCFSSEI